MAIKCQFSSGAKAECQIFSFTEENTDPGFLPSHENRETICSGCAGGKLVVEKAEENSVDRTIKCVKQGLGNEDDIVGDLKCNYKCDDNEPITTQSPPPTTTTPEDLTGKCHMAASLPPVSMINDQVST